MLRTLFVIVIAVVAVSSKPIFRPTTGRSSFQRYVVKFKDAYDVDKASLQISRHFLDAKWHSRVTHVYKNVARGISIEYVSEEALNWMMQQEFIEFVEEEAVFTATTSSLGADPEVLQFVERVHLNWGLDRITERKSSRKYSYKPTGTGNNVNIFVLDTDVRLSHDQFKPTGRASNESEMFSTDILQCSGHGTQTAGVAASLYIGTATEANIISIPVLNCNGEGSTQDVLNGLETIISRHPNGPGVIMMSISSVDNDSMIYEAIKTLTASNFVLVAAAGNEAESGCYHYPAAYDEVISVGAINARGRIASFSNYGPCVNIYAPGTNIYTAAKEGDDKIQKMTGTSFAAPFVAGVAAIHLANEVEANDVMDRIINNSTKNVPIINLPDNSVNRILYIGL